MEEVKSLFDSGAVDFVAKAVDALLKSGVAESVVASIKPMLPKLIAEGLAIEGLPADATPEQEQAWAKSVLDAFGVKEDKSKFYTTLGAQLLA
ncbi:MAG: hypothetical protein Q8932_19940, partial [Bacteroidota bacterium]|nr:hypothetical protein [Bacteroidota bacterium]